ncbi:phage integrase N-terminal SAM-like domain-containing protein [bacterium]|nr:phage integrase N-terminal SAM-like domain-containing protein [bacterium]
MTELRTRMLQDMQLHGYSQRTQELYLRAVRQLAEHYHKPPDQITEEELRDYFLEL